MSSGEQSVKEVTLKVTAVVVPPNNFVEIQALEKCVDDENGRAVMPGEPNAASRTVFPNQLVELFLLDRKATEMTIPAVAARSPTRRRVGRGRTTTTWHIP